MPTFSAIDPSYALPNNIAVITLQVMGKFLMDISSKLGPVNVNEDGVVINFFFFLILQELANGKVLLRLAHLYEVCLSAYKAKSGHSGYQLKSLLKKKIPTLKICMGYP